VAAEGRGWLHGEGSAVKLSAPPRPRRGGLWRRPAG
jgi:hypothetical protein